MRRIINGKMYDTDKATLIYTDPQTKRKYYMTAKGAFFVVYTTGVLEPVSDEYMMQLLGEKDPDKYIEIFGEVEEA